MKQGGSDTSLANLLYYVENAHVNMKNTILSYKQRKLKIMKELFFNEETVC